MSIRATKIAHTLLAHTSLPFINIKFLYYAALFSVFMKIISHINAVALYWHEYKSTRKSTHTHIHTYSYSFPRNLINKLQLDYKFSFLYRCCSFCDFSIPIAADFIHDYFYEAFVFHICRN